MGFLRFWKWTGRGGGGAEDLWDSCMHWSSKFPFYLPFKIWLEI